MAGTRERSAGALEAQVMQTLWSAHAPRSARAIQATFPDPAPAPTTILTVLSRLEQKGLVLRHATSPRKVTFEAAVSSAENHADAMRAALERAEDHDGALLAFADTLSPEDVELMLSAIARRGAAADPS